MIAAISVKVEEPMFESQTKTKLGSKEMGPNGPTVRNFIVDFLKTELDNFLHKHPETADILQKKYRKTKKERKAISGIQKKARDGQKVSLNNKKLRDCRIHLTDRNDRAEESMIFITEVIRPAARSQIARREYAGRVQPPGKAAELLRANKKNRLRERGIQPAAGGAEHRGRTWTTCATTRSSWRPMPTSTGCTSVCC